MELSDGKELVNYEAWTFTVIIRHLGSHARELRRLQEPIEQASRYAIPISSPPIGSAREADSLKMHILLVIVKKLVYYDYPC